MWKLQTEADGKRTWQNAMGSKCFQTMCYKDKEGNLWYSFDDLLQMPYTRNFAATKVSSLYSLGLTQEDLSAHINGIKTLLRSDDREKYEKIYANVLDFETKAMNATNAIKQMTGLACVYFTINDEPIDTFDGALQIKKMALMEAEPEMHAFFLNRQMLDTEDYTKRLMQISQIVLQQTAENNS